MEIDRISLLKESIQKIEWDLPIIRDKELKAFKLGRLDKLKQELLKLQNER
ncbi:MAG: hypothetical protein KJ601_04000 [Nanoarchaeota archaeon]|nr:hypothetical protein [Nanoarchaeota archaeon]MBU1704001.1 hypothetical protein [Nanoarchaeota archaeon]